MSYEMSEIDAEMLRRAAVACRNFKNPQCDTEGCSNTAVGFNLDRMVTQHKVTWFCESHHPVAGLSERTPG